MTLKKNLLKNGIASTIQKIIKVLEQLLLIPFFISAWGAEYYGEWLTLTIIPSMLAFSDLGFGSSAANKFLLHYAAGDKQAAANTAKNGLAILTIVVVLSIFLSIIALIILDYFKIFDKSLIKRTDALWAVSFLMIARIICFYQQLYEAFYRAARRAALSINLQTIYSGLNILAGLLVLIFGKGIILFALTNLLVALLFNPYYIIKATKILRLSKTHHGHISKSEIKDIASNGFGYLLSPIWQAIYFQGTTFVVRLTLGPLAVTIFNTVRTLTRAVNQAFSLVIGSTFPEFQFEIGAGNLEKAKRIFRLTFELVLLLAIGGIIFLYTLGPWFYEIWTHKALNPPAAMWNIFILGIAFNAVWWTAIIIFQAINKPYYFTVAGTIAACISVISTYFLSKTIGLTGAAIGSFILDILLAFYVLPQGLKYLKLTLKSFAISIPNDIDSLQLFLKKKLTIFFK